MKCNSFSFFCLFIMPSSGRNWQLAKFQKSITYRQTHRSRYWDPIGSKNVFPAAIPYLSDWGGLTYHITLLKAVSPFVWNRNHSKTKRSEIADHYEPDWDDEIVGVDGLNLKLQAGLEPLNNNVGLQKLSLSKYLKTRLEHFGESLSVFQATNPLLIQAR